MTETELFNIYGGATQISASLLNAIARGVNSLYNLGRAFGTAIRMIVKGKSC